MENKKKIIRNIAICMLLLIVASLYIAIKKNKDAEWFDEKELYSFSKETSCEELECKGYLCISDVFNEIPYKVKFFVESIEQGKDCYIKVYNQNEYDLIVHIFYYKRESDCIKEISYNRNLLGGLYRENPVKSRNYEAVKSSKKWENVGNSYIIPALLLYRYSYI